MMELLGGIVGALLLSAAAIGIVVGAGREESGWAGILGAILRVLPFSAMAFGFLIGFVDLVFVGDFDSILRVFLGIGIGCGVAPVLVGFNLFFDMLCPSFYACLRREAYAHFVTPIPYFVLLIFLLLCGFFFYGNLTIGRTVSLRPTLDSVSALCFFLFPLLTMGLFSRERSEGTIEVLMTAPISHTSVTMAKFLGTMAFYAVMLLPTLIFYQVLRVIGAEIGKPDPGPVISAYLGMILAGGFFISVGLFTSAATKSQILGALMSWALILCFLLARPIAGVLGLAGTWLGDALEYADPTGIHLQPFLRGVIDPKNLIFFLSFTAFFLFLAVRTIAGRKWR